MVRRASPPLERREERGGVGGASRRMARAAGRGGAGRTYRESGMVGSVQAEGQLKFCLELKCFSTGPRASLNLHCNIATRHDGVVVGWRRSTGVVQTASRCGYGDAPSSAKCGGSYKERLVPRASPGRWRWRVRGQARGGAASARAGRRARAPCENGRCTRRVAVAGESCVGEGQRGVAGAAAT